MSADTYSNHWKWHFKMIKEIQFCALWSMPFRHRFHFTFFFLCCWNLKTFQTDLNVNEITIWIDGDAPGWTVIVTFRVFFFYFYFTLSTLFDFYRDFFFNKTTTDKTFRSLWIVLKKEITETFTLSDSPSAFDCASYVHTMAFSFVCSLFTFVLYLRTKQTFFFLNNGLTGCCKQNRERKNSSQCTHSPFIYTHVAHVQNEMIFINFASILPVKCCECIFSFHW